MADQIRTAQYFKLTIGDKSGTLAHMLAPLHEAGVNLLAVHAFPRNRRTQVDVVPEDPTAFKDITKPLKWKVQGPKVCFRRQTEGRVLQSNIAGLVCAPYCVVAPA
jgi:hypothetical protein